MPRRWGVTLEGEVIYDDDEAELLWSGVIALFTQLEHAELFAEALKVYGR